MSQEDIELLSAVRNWVPTTELHPIAVDAWTLYEANGFRLPPEALDKLRSRLAGLEGDLGDLAMAIETMVRFTILVSKKHGDPETGEKVTELLREFMPHFEPFWRQVGNALINVSAEARAAFERFTGEVSEKTAAAVGEPPPRGAISMRSFLTPARPPAWAKKKAVGAK